ncbi:MFS transporter [Herbaspirillum sp. NPDC087042]|uniref:MFS transporter n=1 Tax=Herbaspirillum sp. NPDC087042 TaxID=3364004 RepID=UPI0038137414
MSTAAASKRTGYRWLVLVMIYVTYMIAGADRANIGVTIPEIRKDFHLSNTDVGALASLFYITYALIQIPAGYLFERFGIRKILVGSMVLTSLSTFLTGAAGSAFQIKASRAILGAAEGPINIGIVSTINRWFPPHEKGLATGVFMSAIKFAPAFVPPLCAWLMLHYGWREVFYIFAVPGFLSAFLWYWLVRDDPSEVSKCSPQEQAYIKESAALGAVAQTGRGRAHVSGGWLDKLIRLREIELLKSNAEILRSWNVWACALGYFFMVGITYAIMTWVPTYLVSVKHFSIMKMGVVASAPWVGAIVGNLLGGWLSDNFFGKRRKPVMLITSAATVVMMYTLIAAPSEPTALAALFFVAGVLLNLGYSTFLVYPMGIATKEKVPFAASIVNFAGSLGGAFTPFVVGVILDNLDWDWVFGLLALSSLITFFLVLSMIEPRPRSRVAEPAVGSTGKTVQA